MLLMKLRIHYSIRDFNSQTHLKTYYFDFRTVLNAVSASLAQTLFSKTRFTFCRHEGEEHLYNAGYCACACNVSGCHYPKMITALTHYINRKKKIKKLQTIP